MMENQAPDATRYLFVAGCPRSGTTAMVHLLNADPRIIVGRERFKFTVDTLGPDHFAPEHFFAPTEDETNDCNPTYYGRLKARWDTGGVAYIGDKFPHYFRHLHTLRKRFPGCRFLFMVRELETVASSYNVRAQREEDTAWPPHQDYQYAVKHWNESLMRLCQYVQAHGDADIFPVLYESLYSGDMAYLEALYDFLELPLIPEVSKKFAEMTTDWESRANKSLQLDDAMRSYLDSKRDKESEQYAISMARRRLRENAEAPELQCPICGSGRFVQGPGGRMSVTGRPPRCARCGALERDRVVHRFWSALAHQAPLGPVLRLQAQTALPDAFAPGEDLKLPLQDPAKAIENLRTLKADAYEGISCNYILQQLPEDVEAFHCLYHSLADNGVLQLSLPAVLQNETTQPVPPNAAREGGPHWRYGADVLTRFGVAGAPAPLLTLGEDEVTGAHERLYLFFKTPETRRKVLKALKENAHIQAIESRSHLA